MVPTTARLNEVLLERLNRPSALYLAALLRDEKVATFPSSVATVGTTSALVLASQSTRVFAEIINISDTDIDLAFGEAAVVGQGPRLVANGGVYTIDWENLWKGAINGVTTAANKNIATVDGRVG